MRSTPLGILAPRVRKRSGNLRKSTTSSSSAFASSTPATSEKLTVGLLPTNMRALLRPKLKVWFVLPCACLIMKRRMAPKKISGRKLMNILNRLPRPLDPFTISSSLLVAMSTPALVSCSTKLEPCSLRDVSVSPAFVRTVSLSPLISMTSTSPLATSEITRLMGTSLDPSTEKSVNMTAMRATTISR